MNDNKPMTRIDAFVGHRLRVQRLARSPSREQLAQRLRLSSSAIQRYENGIDRISASKLCELSLVLDVPVAYFFRE